MIRLQRYYAKLTNLVKHLVTLVENKSLDVAERKLLVADKGVKTTGSTDDDIGESVLIRQSLDILLNGSTTVEDGGLYIGKILAESSVFVLDLISQLTSVAHNQDGTLSRNRLQLVKGGKDEDSRLSKTGLGLAKNIDVQDSGRNANLLDYGDAERYVRLWFESMKLEREKTIRLKVRPSQ